jgi:pimeloyl-ACP methyl ester carboxylesterase
MPETIDSFRIEVPDEVLSDLQQRLRATRFPDQIEGVGWNYGTELGYLQELVAYWRDKFDWRHQEAELNRHPQFLTEVQGQKIHFVHARSQHADAHPLLLVHGWPGGVSEFNKVLGPLVDPEAHGGKAEDAFHVVCPSLPGFGFSGPTHETGWSPYRMAEAFAELMDRLGYGRYGAQGGDWGSIISTNLGGCDAQHLSGIHLNMPLAIPPASGHEGLTEAEKADLADGARFDAEGTGYQKIQGTKPQSLGYGLNDSPAGLAGWITEKFHAWTDCDGEVENAVTKDELLTVITTYWVTQTIASSMRIYREMFTNPRMAIFEGRVEVPTGIARFPKEIMRFPRAWVENHYNVTHWTEMPKGGHFAALEQPELFVEDVRSFFATVR